MNIAHRVTLHILAALSLVVILTCGCGNTPQKNPPRINSFGASPSEIIFGETSTLTWSVSNAKSLSISPGVGAVTGSSIIINPTSTTNYTLTATGDGGRKTVTTTVAVKTVADTLYYTDPVSGTYQLLKNIAKSNASHLVLDLVGPQGSVSGVGFSLNVDQAKVTWTTVDSGDIEKVKNSVFSDALVKTKVTGDILEAGVYQKGTITAISATTTTVLASVALDIKNDVLITNPPTLNLTAVSGKAIILNPPGSLTPTDPISIATGILRAI